MKPKNYSVKHYAVIGNPIKHSYSPEIHKLFSRQFNLSISYKRILASENNLEADIKEFANSGGHGMNVTLPFKEKSFQILSKLENGVLSERACLAGAINTITFRNGKLYGCNTDGAGLIKDLSQKNFVLKEKNILLVGAGGAARGVLNPLAEEGCSKIHIVNRTAERALEICNSWNSKNSKKHLLTNVTSGNLSSAAISKWDLIINATNTSLHRTFPNLPKNIYSIHSMAYDMMYSSRETLFLESARKSGAFQCSDGLGMLVAQAAESFLIWHGVYPDLPPIVSFLRAILS